MSSRFAHARIAAIVVSVVAMIVASTPRRADAQSTFATLTGIVTDQSGAVLPGVTISVISVATGLERSATTDGAGEFQVPSLDAAMYRMFVRLDGFADASRDIQMLARQTVRADVQLRIAGRRSRSRSRRSVP